LEIDAVTQPPPIIDTCGALLARYRVLFCDVWGVLHDGNIAFPAANEALTAFRAAGGTVILVSNAPMPAATVARVLDSKGVVRAAWDRIVSSGDIALRHIEEKGWQQIHQIGPPKRDKDFFAALGGPSAPIETAEAIACTGLLHDRTETAETYRPLLEQALRRQLPFVCANPDLAVHVGAVLLPCAGAIAEIYQTLGGPVFWAGKPHPIAYRTAFAAARDIRGSDISPAEVLAIGDSIRTDLAAAAGAGVDALFITSGIHRDETMEGSILSAGRLAPLFPVGGVPAVAAASALRP
jgi:HAD superfamily hydrolase (TIGR01459 family)